MPEVEWSAKYRLLARLSDALLFLCYSVRHPLRLAAPLPSCKRAAGAVAREITRKPAARVVELGAGTGGLTRGILQALSPDNVLLCVEREGAFCRRVARRFDGRVKVVQADACDVLSVIRGTAWERPDVIVCSVPLLGRAGTRLCEQIAEALPPCGLYLQITNRPAAMRPFFTIERVYFFPTYVPPERLFCAVRRSGE